MNKAAFLAGYMSKVAMGDVNPRSFSAAVGNATKKAMKGSSGEGSSLGISRDKNLPSSSHLPKYHNVKDTLLADGVGHPVRPTPEEEMERVKEYKK